MSERCNPGESYVNMNDEFKEALLNGHNKKRSLVGQGKLDGVFSGKAATRMATLVSNYTKIYLLRRPNVQPSFFSNFGLKIMFLYIFPRFGMMN